QRLGRPDFVVAHEAGDVERVALVDPDRATILEFQIHPALQHVDELAIAFVIVPTGRPAHALARHHHLGTHGPRACVGDAKIAVLEELAPSLDQHWFADARVRNLLPGNCLGWACDDVRHRFLHYLHSANNGRLHRARQNDQPTGVSGRKTTTLLSPPGTSMR